jgi:phage portal protein BeeE
MPDEEQTKQVQQRLGDYGLRGGQKKVIVTTQKLRWEQMSLGVQELQLIENAQYSFERLCQLSEFDPVIFSTEGSTFANKEQAIKDLYKNVIKGDVDELYENINSFISPGYGGDKIVPDWDKVQELESDKKVYTDMLTKQIEAAIITPLKANEILYGEGNYPADNPPPDEYFTRSTLKKINEPEPVDEIVDPALVAELNTDKDE